ncbi:Rib/alpha-like domain-containing protein [Streptococcus merionis]|uniref:Surface protein Rib n=1 Tax=Streptococcus merionis TaxID=400065 RepID=A0A239SMH4_9STRE|nr:Rib/alpha-like domain-containing protein [Streptococcus merionis]SNU86635.1 Surface protein Rib [Streptococcus merionis]
MFNNSRQKNHDVSQTRQRFSIKKFKFGAASVLVGLSFLGMSGYTVLAEESSPAVESTTEAEKTPSPSDEATVASEVSNIEGENTAEPQPTESVIKPEVSAEDSLEKSTDNVSNSDESSVEKNVSSSPAIATRSLDSTVANGGSIDDNKISEVSEELQKKAQQGAIYSPGDSSAKQTYSGKAWIDNGGSIDGQAPDDTPLAGVNVYLQWVDGKGYVSKVYYTTTQADGTFAFDLSKPEVDSNGEMHHFQLAGDTKFAVRTWIENPDSNKYDIIQAGDKIYGFHTRLNRKNESWDFTAGVNRIINSQVILQEKKLSQDWLTKPDAEVQIPDTADGTWHDRGIYGRVSGTVWFDNGDGPGTLANQWIKDGNDVPANGVKVAASYLNDEVTRMLDQWKKGHPGYTSEDFKAEQERVFKEYQAQHGVGSHIAETVITTVDKNGNYTIPFRGLYGVSAYKANSGAKISYTVTDEEFGTVVRDEDVDNSKLLKWNGTIGQKHRHINEDYLYVSPVLSSYNIWSPAFPKTLFGNPNNVFTNVVAGSGTNITSLNFAILAPQPMLDVIDYDTTNKVAVSGNVTNSTVGGLLPTREYQVQWFRDGVAIGDPQVIQSSVEGTATPEKFTVPGDITKTTNFTLALFEQGQDTKTLDNALALDSFIAVFIEYKPVDGVVAKDSEPAKPVFKDKDGNDTAPLEGTTFATVTGQVPDSVKNAYPEGAISVDPSMVTIDPETGSVVVKGDALTKKGTYVVPVEVTYPGGSKAHTFATVNVKDDATTTYTATGGKLEKPFGQSPSTDEITSTVTTDYPKDVKDQPTLKVEEGAVIPDGNTKGEFKVPVVVTYPDGTTDKVDVSVTIKESEAEKNDPSYKDTMVVPGKPAESTPSYGEGKTAPNGTEYKVDEDFKVPDGYKVDLDKSTGKVTVTAPEKPDGTTAEEIEVPVIVTYPDKSEDKVTAKFQLDTDGNGTPDVKDTDDDGDGIPDTDDKNPKTATKTGVAVDNATVTEGQPITPIPVTVTSDDKNAKVEVTDLPAGLAYNQEKGEVTGTPDKLADWEATEEARDFTTTVKVTDASGVVEKPFTITVQRDTDGDGTPDVKDTDDDGDGIPDDTEKTDGTNSKDPNSAASVITPIDDQTGTVGEAITPILVKVDKVPTDGSVEVTGLPDGVTYDKAKGQITGTPTKEGETTVTVAVLGKDGKPVMGADGQPVTEEFKFIVKEQLTEADKNEPIAKEQQVNLGDTPKAEDSIANLPQLPKGTEVAFETPIDTTTAGDKPGKVVVTYPDGSTDTVDVTVKVVDPRTDAAKHEPIAKDQQVNLGDTPKAEDSIANLPELPAGTKVAFETPIDTTTAGDKPGKVVVTYPDGSTDTVDVTVKVVDPRTDAAKHEPIAKEQQVNLGDTPKAEDSIANLPELPAGTKVAFETPIDTTTAGDKPGKVVVTYPDGSTDTVDVTVKVVDPRTDAAKHEPIAKDQQVKPLASVVNSKDTDNKDQNADNKDKENKLPATGEKESPFFNMAALAIIASVGLLSIPKKEED